MTTTSTIGIQVSALAGCVRMTETTDGAQPIRYVDATPDAARRIARQLLAAADAAEAMAGDSARDAGEESTT